MTTISTHVLDTTLGRPAVGIAITLGDVTGAQLGAGVTDGDGRIGQLGPDLAPGDYVLTFATGDYFASLGTDAFYPQVSITFTVVAGVEHYHVPLLLNPFGFSTYRGS